MAVEELEAAAAEREQLGERVAGHGESDVGAVADAYRSFTDLLGRYEDAATGTGNFETYVEFQERVAQLVEGLDDDLPERAAFEAAGDALEQRTLREKHFDRAREALAPARELADLLSEWEDARERYRDARLDARRRLETVEERVADLERLLELGDADIEAPVERLREPIEAYDEAVQESFRAFRRETSTRAVLEFLATAAEFPLVGFRSPPTRLFEYVRENPAGEESITTLLEYADYSQSKLGHYVDDPAALKRHVATNRTYLEGLDADPLTVGWPPPTAEDLRFRCREYEAVVHRFAPESVIEQLRTVRGLPRETDYERLRQSAVARAELSESERERLASGAIEAELADLRAEREELVAALEEHPERS
jgi:hypothetical protein